MTLASDRIAVPNEQIAAFCRQWQIVESGAVWLGTA